MAVLVCGGAGYIGSHVVNELLKQNIETVVIDSLEYGHKDAIKDCKNFYHGNIGDSELLDKIFKSHNIDFRNAFMCLYRGWRKRTKSC